MIDTNKLIDVLFNEERLKKFEDYLFNPLNWKPTNIFVALKEEENWRGKILWLLHPKDTYGKHQERYYNLPSIKKLVKYIEESEEEE